MRAPHTDAGRRTLALWRRAPLRARVHTTVRWWSAPFEALGSAVPSSGAVLEVGCGHGLLATYLALAAPGRSVVGIDIDQDKIAVAREVVASIDDGEPPTLEVREAGEVPRVEGGWRAIVIADVLYLLDRDQQRTLLATCVDALAPGGELLIKEVDTRPRLKSAVAHAQEFLATKVLRITRGEHIDFSSAAELELMLDELGLCTTARRLDHGYFHPHCLITGVRPAH